MFQDDPGRLADMADSGDKLASILAGKTRADVEEDDVLALAIARLIEIIGEAARYISDDAKAKIAIPWGDIIGMRNVLIHAYHRVDLDLVWEAASKSAPLMVAAVRRHLASVKDQ